MPLTLNVGLSQKVGEANYGSRGANVNFDVELESSLVREPDELREKIRYLFGLAKEAVEEELRGQDRKAPQNGHDSNSHHGNGSHQSRNGRPATASQVRAIHAIADRQRVDLAGLLRGSYGVEDARELSVSGASKVIDSLKAEPNGAGGRR